MVEPRALNKKQVEELEKTMGRFDMSHMLQMLVGYKRSVASIHMLAMGMGRGDWVAYANVELSMDTPDGMILWQSWKDEWTAKNEGVQSETARVRQLSARCHMPFSVSRRLFRVRRHFRVDLACRVVLPKVSDQSQDTCSI